MTDVTVIEPVEQCTLPPVRPAKAWYLLGVAVIVGGLASAFFLLTAAAFGYLREIDDLVRVALPAEGRDLVLPSGELVVYHEPRGALVRPPDLEVAFDPSAEVVASCCDGYEVEGRRGWEVARVQVPSAGTYRIRAAGGDGSLAIGPEPGQRLSAFGWSAVVTAATTVLVGLAIVVTVARRRRRSEAQRLAAQAPASGRAGDMVRRAGTVSG